MKDNSRRSQLIALIGAILLAGTTFLFLTQSSPAQRRRRATAVAKPTPTPSPVVYARLKEVTFWRLPSRDPDAQALENNPWSYIPRNVRQSWVHDVPFGEPLTVLSEQKGFEEYGRWYKVQTRDESHVGWVHSFVVTDSKENLEAIRASGRIPTLLMISGRYTAAGFKNAAYRVQGYLEASQYKDGVITLRPGQAVYFPVDWNFVDFLEMRNYGNEFVERPSMQRIYIVNDAGKLEPWKY